MIERSGGDVTIQTHREFAGIACVLVALNVFSRGVGIARGGNSLGGKEVGDQCCALSIVLAPIFIRNELEKDLHPGIPHESREVTRGIVLEAASRRIGCLVLDLCQLQRQGIHEGRMATAVLDEHRVIGPAASRSPRLMGRGVLPSSYKNPSTHSPGGVCSARWCKTACIFSMESVSQATLRRCCTPDSTGWACASLKPGSTLLNARSILRVRAVARGRTSAFEPTARNLPLLMATA